MKQMSNEKALDFVMNQTIKLIEKEEENEALRKMIKRLLKCNDELCAAFEALQKESDNLRAALSETIRVCGQADRN